MLLNKVMIRRRLLLNTGAVAKLLGVSQSTIQRWIKQLNLNMTKNEHGHYAYSEEDIQLLKRVHDQLNTGVLLQDVKVTSKKIRHATISSPKISNDELSARMDMLEQRLNAKADDVTSYQLLHHRQELEELHAEIERLHERIHILEKKNFMQVSPIPSDSPTASILPKKRIKKRNILTMLFGIKF